MTQYIDPTLLGITPPMDVSSLPGSVPGSLQSWQISRFPLQLRRYVGLFGTRRRPAEGRMIRMHEGVDLLAPIGTPVFAVQDGKIISVTVAPEDPMTTITIEHTLGFRYTTFYSEIQNPGLFQRNADGNLKRDDAGNPIIGFAGKEMIDQFVLQGERIAEVRDFDPDDDPSEDQLHFEIRYPFAQTGSRKRNTFAVDPTWALYAWEKKLYPHNSDTRNVVSETRIVEFREIVRQRQLRFLCIRVEGLDRNLYFPLGHLEDEDKSLVETLRSAFFHGKAIELVWRESLFFNQIEFAFDETDKIAILVEVKVIW